MQRLLLLLLVSTTAWSAGFGFAQQPVFVENVQQQTTQATERVLGSLRARSTSVMAALEEGVLLELLVREGQPVAAGEVLARLDTRRLQAERARLQADLAMGAATELEREARLGNSEIDLESMRKASESGAVSERDLRTAQTQVLIDRAQLDAARQSNLALQANLDLLAIRIADCSVVAPFAGSVTARHAEVGQWIHQGDPLVTLVSTGALEAWLQIPERFTGQVGNAGTPMVVRLEATGTAFEGKSPRTIPMVEERARTFSLLLDVLPPAGSETLLQAGMSISAEVPIGRLAEHLIVAPDAVLRRGDQALVAKVGPGEVAALVPIRVLFRVAEGFAVEPLEPGALEAKDRVVVEGNERLYPGTKLLPQVREAKVPASEPGRSETASEPRTDLNRESDGETKTATETEASPKGAPTVSPAHDPAGETPSGSTPEPQPESLPSSPQDSTSNSQSGR